MKVSEVAHAAVARAIKRGELVIPERCEKCLDRCLIDRFGRLGIHAHHDDYRKPLDVRWLCRSCHGRWHSLNGPGLGDDELLKKKRAASRRIKPCDSGTLASVLLWLIGKQAERKGGKA